MGNPLDFMDEGGWPYPDEVADGPDREPLDLWSTPDDDLIALHALAPRVLASLTADERAAVAGRFGLDGGSPMTMAELRATLGLSRHQARAVLSGGIGKLREALADGPP